MYMLMQVVFKGFQAGVETRITGTGPIGDRIVLAKPPHFLQDIAICIVFCHHHPDRMLNSAKWRSAYGRSGGDRRIEVLDERKQYVLFLIHVHREVIRELGQLVAKFEKLGMMVAMDAGDLVH